MTPVCLIIPPSAFLLDERVFLSLGILKVAAALEQRGRKVEVLDLSGVTNFEAAVKAHANHAHGRIWALTATTPQMPNAARIATAIATVRPAARIIIGGPHPTLVAAAYKREHKRGVQGRATRAMLQLQRMFDVTVAGDGEDAIEEALRLVRLRNEAPSKEFGFVVDADDPKGPLWLTPKRLAETPWPARHLVDLASYHYKVNGLPATTLVAQLGCPFGCTFCGGRASPMLRRARQRPTAGVLAEIEHLHTAYGYRGFMLYDDELNVNPDMVELMRGIAALQRKHGTTFALRGFVKAELMTQEIADSMREAGFHQLLCGFESGSPRILDNINKKAAVEDNDRAVAYARAAGMTVKALMSIGHAGESALTIAETKAWLLSTRPDDFDCTIITPYPGSPYYDEATEADVSPRSHAAGQTVWTYRAPRTGDRLHMFELDYFEEADYYKGKPGGGYVSHVFTDELTPADLVELRDELENSVRATLGIPFNPGAPGVMFEASMGATKLPPNILRESAP